MTDSRELCPRTVALYKPGTPQPGVYHHYAYSGSVPNTGRLRCILCGQDKPTENRSPS